MSDAKENKQLLQVPGSSRWSEIKEIVNCSYGFFAKLGKLGKAPAPRKLSARMVVYSNEEVLEWLANPSTYDQAAIDAKRKMHVNYQIGESK